MRISDLSRRTGVPVATIKFYLRDRLLPPGKPIGRNQAEYGEAHLRRLRLIRAFTNIAHLDLSTVRELLTSIEDERIPIGGLYDVVNRAMLPDEPALPETEGVAQAHADVDAFLASLGWHLPPDAAGRKQLADVLAALQRLECECGVEYFTPYAAAAERLTLLELDLLPNGGSDAADRAPAVVRAVLLEAAFTAIRRLAQEHLVAQRFGKGPERG